MKTELLDYHLPEHLIALHPSRVRRQCRLLVLDRATGEVAHHRFEELPLLLAPRDLLVVNDTAVIPARLLGHRVPGGGKAEILLLDKKGARTWRAMVRPGAKLRPGAVVEFPRAGDAVYTAAIAEAHPDGTRTVVFKGKGKFDAWLNTVGAMPLPPYIDRPAEPRDKRDYQTIFARKAGAVAAPTAGLHFDAVLIDRLKKQGIDLATLTLHVGAGTFRPITSDCVEDHILDSEPYQIGTVTQKRIWKRYMGEGRVVAVGTTVTRALETLAVIREWPRRSLAASMPKKRIQRQTFEALVGRTNLFIRPGYQYRVVDVLITNFHLPKSSLLALVAAFAAQKGGDGLAMVKRAYDIAVREEYRFYSYGDAMLIL
jgi:S-adenosylmethionine:tRNA ribosyltransferase-isomerase